MAVERRDVARQFLEMLGVRRLRLGLVKLRHHLEIFESLFGVEQGSSFRRREADSSMVFWAAPDDSRNVSTAINPSSSPCRFLMLATSRNLRKMEKFLRAGGHSALMTSNIRGEG
jgi:hypothetical protein